MAALEESITAMVSESMAEVTQETIRAAKRRLSTLKGHLTLKRKYLTNKQASLINSSEAETPNHAVLRSISDELQQNIERMLSAAEKYQTAVSQYLAIGEGSSEETSTYYKSLKTDSDAIMTSCLEEASAATKAIAKHRPEPARPAPAVAGQTEPKLRPEKELKPSVLLDSLDSMETYKRWLAEFRQYFNVSNFATTSPEAQRIFLSKCMDQTLWDRLSGSEPEDEKIHSINPDEPNAGIFKHLSLIFGLQDPLLLKRTQLFTSQKFQAQEFESFSTYMARRNLLKKDAAFYKMTHDDFDLVWAFHGISDPKLRNKLLALESPSLQQFILEGQKYENIQTKKKLDEMVRQRGNGVNGVTTIEENSSNTNSVQTSRPKAKRFCRACSKPTSSPKYSLCEQCFKQKTPPNSNAPPANFRGGGRGDSRGRGGYRGGRGRTPNRGNTRGRGFSRFSSRSNNPMATGNTAPRRRPNTNNIETSEQSEEGQDEYNLEYLDDEENYMYPDGTSSEVNRVIVSQSSSTVPGPIKVQKVDWTVFPKSRQESHWRLKCLARLRRHKQPSKQQDLRYNPFLPIILTILSLWETFYSKMANIYKSIATNFHKFIGITKSLHKVEFLKNIKAQKLSLSNSPWSMMVNTIVCNKLLTNEPAKNPNAQDIYEHGPEQISPDLHNVMEKGLNNNLDNMLVTLGNSKSEIQQRNRVRAKLFACPDSGASRTLCGPKLAKQLGCKIYWEKLNIANASGNAMKYNGTVFCTLSFENKTIEVPIILCPDVEGRLIVGKHDLIRLHILPPDFPKILPERMFRNGQL